MRETIPMEPQEGRVPHCPWCGEECDTFFKDKFGEVIGCENCVTEVDAADAAYLVEEDD